MRINTPRGVCRRHAAACGQQANRARLSVSSQKKAAIARRVGAHQTDGRSCRPHSFKRLFGARWATLIHGSTTHAAAPPRAKHHACALAPRARERSRPRSAPSCASPCRARAAATRAGDTRAHHTGHRDDIITPMTSSVGELIVYRVHAAAPAALIRLQQRVRRRHPALRYRLEGV